MAKWRKLHFGDDIWLWTISKGMTNHVVIKHDGKHYRVSRIILGPEITPSKVKEYIKKNLLTDKEKEKHRRYESLKRKGRKYSLHEILQHVPEWKSWRNKQRVVIDGDPIKVTSDRLCTFKKSHKCAKCGLEGAFFVKEKSSLQDGSFHMNMYGVDNGEDILMTKDHIIPKAHGGRDHIDNYQTMCVRCNLEKANKIE